MDLEEVAPQRKGMAVTRSVGEPMTSFDVLAQAITAHATRACEKLRIHGLVAGTLTAFFHTNRHKSDRPQHSASRSVSLKPMSADTFDLVGAAMRCIRAGWKGDPSGNGHGYGYTKAGIILDDLIRAEDAPRLLFEPDRPRSASLMKALDPFNDRFGKNTMVLATKRFEGSWGLPADHQSPRYTTRITDMPIVRV